MKQWRLYKDRTGEKPCWYICHMRSDGNARYFGEFDYPTAAALRDALMDKDIREFATKSISLPILTGEADAYVKAHIDTYQTIYHLPEKYNGKPGAIYERLIADAIKAEQE